MSSSADGAVKRVSKTVPTAKKEHAVYTKTHTHTETHTHMTHTNPQVRLWIHEAQRVFGDRLVDEADREWFLDHIQTTVIKNFNVKFYDCTSRHACAPGTVTVLRNEG